MDRRWCRKVGTVWSAISECIWWGRIGPVWSAILACRWWRRKIGTGWSAILDCHGEVVRERPGDDVVCLGDSAILLAGESFIDHGGDELGQF